MQRNSKLKGLAAVSAAALLALTACGGQQDGAAPSGDAKGPLQVAVLAASSQNGYNQAVFEGVKQKAEELDVEIEANLLDGQFDANTQLSQLQNAGAGDQYDGVIVVPHDGPALEAGMPLANGIPVVSVLNPIGPDINQMEPQVEGVVSTVAVPPSDAAAKQAERVVEYCQDLDPCKVVLLVGSLSSPLDVTRKEAYTQELSGDDNIEIVATIEGNYSRDDSLTAVANMLQGTPDVNVILSNADQQTFGAEIALKNAGIDPSSVYLTGGGGTTAAIEAVREGRWQSDYLNFPVSMGAAAMEQSYNAMTGEDVKPVVDADEVGDIEPYVNQETLEEYPDFTGEWDG